MANQNPPNQTTNQKTTAQQHTGKDPQNTRQQAQGAAQRNMPGQIETQTTYWRDQYKNEPYYSQGTRFEDYEPAYRLGAEARAQHPGQKFNEVEDTLRNEYEASKGASKLGWDQAKQATQAAWKHAELTMKADTDRQTSQR